MTTITITKNLTKGEELVIIPRKEYEEFSYWHKNFKQFKEFTPTVTQRKDLKRAREEYKQGRYLTLHELKRKLATQNKN